VVQAQGSMSASWCLICSCSWVTFGVAYWVPPAGVFICLLICVGDSPTHPGGGSFSQFSLPHTTSRMFMQLGDFGVAATLERGGSWGGGSLVGRASLVGTPCWMAPEVGESWTTEPLSVSEMCFREHCGVEAGCALDSTGCGSAGD
jgi:hypothetical protein